MERAPTGRAPDDSEPGGHLASQYSQHLGQQYSRSVKLRAPVIRQAHVDGVAVGGWREGPWCRSRRVSPGSDRPPGDANALRHIKAGPLFLQSS